jgi:WD40 repeat protein
MKNKIRIYSVETGEVIRDLCENVAGSIIGFDLDPEEKSVLVSCTSKGQVYFWKLSSLIISKKFVRNKIIVF